MRIAVLVCWTALAALQSADLPELPFSRWDYKTNIGIRSRVGTGETRRIPPPIWEAAGRGLVVIPVASLESAQTMQANGTWGRFLLERMPSPEDALQIKITEREISAIVEIEPIPTQEQEAYRKTLPMRLLVPLPASFAAVADGGAEIRTWQIDPDRQYAHILVSRLALPRKRDVKGGLLEQLLCYDRDVSPEDAAFYIFAERRDLELREFDGHKVLWSDLSNDFQPGDAHFEWLNWQSGRIIVSLRIPTAKVHEIAKPYLERYPPTWNAEITFDTLALMLRILDRSVLTMQANIDGPLEYLRYSYRTYPFDLAFYDALNVLIGNESNQLRTHHEDSIDAIQKKWAASPIETLRLEDYRVAMRAHRSGLIATITGLRDRIRKHGLKRSPKGFIVYGDAGG